MNCFPKSNREDNSRANLIEQVMRMTDDDRILFPFLHALPGSDTLLSAVGRLLADPPKAFPLNSPIALWSHPGLEVSTDNWRSFYEGNSKIENDYKTLWGELQFLRVYLKNSKLIEFEIWCCQYEELEYLRVKSNE